MTVQGQIKKNLKEAMLNKQTHARDLLRVVIGEFNREGKEVSDERAVAIMKKMIENAKDQGNVIEVTILEAYIPNQMDSDELSIKINEIIDNLECTSIKDMGRVMNELKACFAGQYDGKMASTLVKELLN